MKNFFLLGMLLSLFTTNAHAMDKTDVVALASVGLLSTSVYCGLEAVDKISESYDTRDPHQRRALTRARNAWLAGAALSGVSGMALLANAVAGKPHEKTRMVFAFTSAGMFAISASCLKCAKKEEERFHNTREEDAADLSEKWKQYAAFTGLCSMIFCVPVVTGI